MVSSTFPFCSFGIGRNFFVTYSQSIKCHFDSILIDFKNVNDVDMVNRDDDDDDELLPLLADSDGRCIITVPAENCDQDCHPDFPGMPDVQTIQNVHCLPLLKRMPVEK